MTLYHGKNEGKHKAGKCGFAREDKSVPNFHFFSEEPTDKSHRRKGSPILNESIEKSEARRSEQEKSPEGVTEEK